MNPCPCGEGVYPGACGCTEASRARYRRRISAPLLDRFDLVVPLSRPDPDELLSDVPGEESATVARRVAAARAALTDHGGDRELTSDAAALLASKLRSGALSARGLHKVTRVARTVAALAGADTVSFAHASGSAVSARRPCGGGAMSAAGESDLPQEAFAVALASIPSMGPARLRTLLASDPPSVAWAEQAMATGGQ